MVSELTIQRDFEFINQLFTEYHKKSHFKKLIRFVKERESTDWEKWLQLELEYFLCKHDDIGEVFREDRYEIDRRKAADKSHIYVDFSIRRKYATKGKFLNIELKQSDSMHRCLNEMVNDFSKYGKIKKSQCDARLLWNVGYYNGKDEKQFNEEWVHNYLGEKLDFEAPFFKLHPIEKTSIVCVVF